MTLNDVPKPTQSLNQTHTPINANFVTIDNAFKVDHVEYVAAGQGKHNKVTMPQQGVAPTTVANEVALYSKLSTLSGETELVVRRQSNGTNYEFTSCGAADPGWTRLPSGILLKWGHASTPVTGFGTYTFPVNPNTPAFSQIFSVQITTYDVNAGDTNDFVRLMSYITTSFNVYGSYRTTVNPLGVPFQYLAIGI